jgi:hypothetical protein
MLLIMIVLAGIGIGIFGVAPVPKGREYVAEAIQKEEQGKEELEMKNEK